MQLRTALKTANGTSRVGAPNTAASMTHRLPRLAIAAVSDEKDSSGLDGESYKG